MNINFLLLTYSVELGCLVSQNNGFDKKGKLNLKIAVAYSVFEISQTKLACKFSYASSYR